MASLDYMVGRKKWFRPQAMLWSDTPATIVDGKYIPSGFEEYSDLTTIQSSNKFLILSDHNRSDISVNPNRIENKKRMVNGTMRSYHTADKLNLSTSWSLLPSRSHSFRPNFYQETSGGNIAGKQKDFSTLEVPPGTEEPPVYFPINQYTVDGGAGAEEIVAWYESHTGPFWVFLSYDKKHSFGSDDSSYNHLAEYNQAILMRISNIDYSIVKRSGSSNGFLGHDLWNISVSLEEV